MSIDESFIPTILLLSVVEHTLCERLITRVSQTRHVKCPVTSIPRLRHQIAPRHTLLFQPQVAVRINRQSILLDANRPNSVPSSPTCRQLSFIPFLDPKASRLHMFLPV